MVQILRNQPLVGAVVTLALFACCGAANAIPCSAGSLVPSIDCQDGLSNNDFPAPDKVNMETFFGFNDWEYLQKWEGGSLDTNMDYGWTVTPPGASSTGNWEFDLSAWGDFEDIMIVLKSGNSDGTFFSGYLLDNMTMPTMGTWDTGGKAISHLTLYARGDSPPGGGGIPEPTSLSLIALAFLGAGYRRKRIIS